MSKHTDTGRAGKKLWILIPVIAVLIIAAALVWLNSVYVYAGGLHRRDSAQIDLRGKSISEERYLRLRAQLPGAEVTLREHRAHVAHGGGRRPSGVFPRARGARSYGGGRFSGAL